MHGGLVLPPANGSALAWSHGTRLTLIKGVNTKMTGQRGYRSATLYQGESKGGKGTSKAFVRGRRPAVVLLPPTCHPPLAIPLMPPPLG